MCINGGFLVYLILSVYYIVPESASEKVLFFSGVNDAAIFDPDNNICLSRNLCIMRYHNDRLFRFLLHLTQETEHLIA